MLDETTNLKSMLRRPDLVCDAAFVGGEWKQAASGATFAVMNPARGDVIAHIPDLSRAEVAQAIDAAQKHKSHGPPLPPRTAPRCCANGTT